MLEFVPMGKLCQPTQLGYDDDNLLSSKTWMEEYLYERSIGTVIYPFIFYTGKEVFEFVLK